MAAAEQANELKNQGNVAFQNQRYEEAVKLFTQAIELDASNHVFWSNRSASFAGMARWHEALEDAEHCVSLKPEWAKGYTRVGLALFKLGQLEEATDAYRQGLELEPQNAGLREGLMECQQAAMTQARRQSQVPPAGAAEANPMAQAFGPDMLRRLEEHPKTKPFMAQQEFVDRMLSLQRDPNSLPQLMAADPRVMEALSVLLGLNLDMGSVMEQQAQEEKRHRQEEERAKETQRKAEEDRKRQEAERKRQEELDAEALLPAEDRQRKEDQRRAQIVKDEGNELFKARKFDAARAKYQEARALDPTQAAFLGNLAAVSLAESRFEDCIQECQEAMTLGEEHKTMDYSLLARLLLRIGTALYKLQRYDESIDYIQRSLLEERTGQANRLMNTVRQAKKKAEDEAYLDPELSEEAKSRGNVHFQAGRWREAIDEYSDSIRRDPTNYKSLCNRAACWIKIMEWEKALEDCNKCIQLEPLFIKAYIRKGNVQFFLKQYPQAVETYEQGLGHDPNNAELLQGRMQVIQAINSEARSGEIDPQRAQEAMKDPAIQAILRNPVMAQVLQDLGPNGDRERAEKALQNPDITSQLEKLVAAGIVRMG